MPRRSKSDISTTACAPVGTGQPNSQMTDREHYIEAMRLIGIGRQSAAIALIEQLWTERGSPPLHKTVRLVVSNGSLLP